MIPSLPIQNIVTHSNETVSTSPQWSIFFSVLISALQNILSDDGLKVPSKTTAELADINNSTFIGRIIFNTTTSEFMVNKTGTFVNVLTA